MMYHCLSESLKSPFIAYVITWNSNNWHVNKSFWIFKGHQYKLCCMLANFSCFIAHYYNINLNAMIPFIMFVEVIIYINFSTFQSDDGSYTLRKPSSNFITWNCILYRVLNHTNKWTKLGISMLHHISFGITQSILVCCPFK